MKRLTISIAFLLLLLCACKESKQVISSDIANLSITQAMNLSNGGRIAEGNDTIYYINYDEGEQGIYKLQSGHKVAECVSSGLADMLYMANGQLHFEAYKEDALYRYSLSNGETRKITECQVRSMAATQTSLYLLMRSDSDSAFEVYAIADGSDIPKRIDFTGISKIRHLFFDGGFLYITAGDNVYRSDDSNQIELYATFPEPLHKSFVVDDWLYSVGNDAIYRCSVQGEINSIAPKYNGLNTTVTLASDNIIYGAIDGLYQYNTSTSKSQKVSSKIYQEIYVVQGKIVGVTISGQGPQYETIG